MKLLRELFTYNRDAQLRCRQKGWSGPVLHLGVEAAIIEDALSHVKAQVKTAFSAEIEDLEAIRLIAEVLADGMLNEDEIPKLQAAQRMIQSSAHKAHSITEALS